jgi:hypothetical protein
MEEVYVDDIPGMVVEGTRADSTGVGIQSSLSGRCNVPISGDIHVPDLFD